MIAFFIIPKDFGDSSTLSHQRSYRGGVLEVVSFAEQFLSDYDTAEETMRKAEPCSSECVGFDLVSLNSLESLMLVLSYLDYMIYGILQGESLMKSELKTMIWMRKFEAAEEGIGVGILNDYSRDDDEV
ncbi:hypothetical protein LIER_42123 [Lithospermum erythrorhizon]|uniref:Uncharacterized protein n=1 Tax=Lithospermum erythrorhizon TaxID=34254 RepID=A0AAV3RJX2_LITER